MPFEMGAVVSFENQDVSCMTVGSTEGDRLTIQWDADEIVQALRKDPNAVLVHTHPANRTYRFEPPSDFDVIVGLNVSRDLHCRSVIQMIVEKKGVWTMKCTSSPRLNDEFMAELVANHQYFTTGIIFDLVDGDRKQSEDGVDQVFYKTPKDYVKNYNSEMKEMWKAQAPVMSWTPWPL
jgi:hypothetical protein